MKTAGTAKWARRYRYLQLLQTKANEIFGYPLASIKVLFLLGAIRLIYGVVKLNGYIRICNLNAAVGYLIFLTVAFKALGEVYERSVKELLQHGEMMSDKWFRRLRRSCPPLKFQVAGMYFVDSPMSLAMGSFVIQNVANMLILGA